MGITLPGKLIRMGLSSFADPISCRDGFMLSIQAGKLVKYCTPVTNMGGWTHFEVEILHGGMEEELLPYMSMNTILDRGPIKHYFVPKEVIVKIINKHGGIASIRKPFRAPFSLKTFMIIDALGIGPLVLINPKYRKTGLRWGS